MKLRALDELTARRLELHGDDWDIMFADGRTILRGAEIAMKSKKTGHIKWWPEFHVRDQAMTYEYDPFYGMHAFSYPLYFRG